MKLLFDQNLSHKLPARLADLFDGASHVRLAGLDRAPDDEIWAYAAGNDFCIVTQDSVLRSAAVCLGHLQRSFGCDAATRRLKKLKAFCGGIPS